MTAEWESWADRHERVRKTTGEAPNPLKKRYHDFLRVIED
jgi:hypothetical protein